ncbi:S46 family peptidase [Fodinibius sp. N2]|uniref:S46 family peptidase n=1 Tax=Fodinibius alkaliphilus TaxID=3140241 RepID=UPI00315A997C
MAHPENPSTLFNYLLIAGLLVFWGCSSPAPVQESHSNNTPISDATKSAKKTSDLSPGEGLWLVSQLTDTLYAELQSKGLDIPADTIYNTNNSSLSNTVVNISIDDNSRGTGALVSNRGLILTNYRTAIEGIARQSSVDENHLQNGFLAGNREQEIPLPNYSIQVLLAQKEITESINKELADTLTYREKKKRTQQIQNQLITQHQSKQKDITVTVDEVWGGNRYIISVYKKIDDVRLVHSPQKSDVFPAQNSFNQSWPSRAADYTFLRAYTAPSGQSRTYDQSNVPFTPDRHLEIDTSNMNKGDYVTTLGYPGKTQRQESSYAGAFYRDHRNPILINSYEAILDAAQKSVQNNPATAIANAPQRMSATQNLTYFRQLQHSIKSDSIPSQKADIEQQFSEWIKKDSLRNITYRRVLPQLKQAYNIASQNGSLLFALVNTFNNSKIMQIAGLYNSYYKHISDTTNPALSNADKQQLLKKHNAMLNGIDVKSQKQFLGDMLYLLSSLPEGNVPFHLLELFGTLKNDTLKQEIESYLTEQQNRSLVFNPSYAQSLLQSPTDSVLDHPKDALVTLYQELLDSYQFSRQNYSQHVPYLQPAQERYVEGLQAFQHNIFPYPDANGTLRLTLGQVDGYRTRDGKMHAAFTQSKGKTINFLTTNDITGGAYGSPVLNNEGKIMGITSYRTTAGIGSDFLFDSKRHRTINVSIDHIINQMSEFSGSHKLLKEMQF